MPNDTAIAKPMTLVTVVTRRNRKATSGWPVAVSSERWERSHVEDGAADEEDRGDDPALGVRCPEEQDRELGRDQGEPDVRRDDQQTGHARDLEMGAQHPFAIALQARKRRERDLASDVDEDGLADSRSRYPTAYRPSAAVPR